MKKKTIPLIFSCLTICCKADAQYYESEREFYGGLIAGGNFTQVDGDNFRGYKKAGINVGGIVYAQLWETEKLAASIEILYVQKGTRGNRIQESGLPGVIIRKYVSKLNYAEVPVQLNYFNKQKSNFGAGFSFAYLASSDEILETNLGTIKTTDYPFRKIDINFVMTGNLHIWKGLFIGARFQYSLIPIRTKVMSGFGRSEQFNNVWAIRCMYLFK